MKIAFMFAGQGSQYTGMGQELYEDHPVVQKMFDQASEILGYDVKEILFQDDERINDTIYTQPLMFVLYASIVEVLKEQGVQSTHTCGLSLGEYGAYYDSGCIDFETGLKLVAARGKAMQEACDTVEGAMSAILGLDAEPLEAIMESVDGVVTIANYNTYGQLVISGEVQAVEQVNEAAKAAGAKRVIPLNTSGPFHSTIMAPAKAQFEEILQAVTLQEPTKSLLTNVNGSYLNQPLQVAMLDQITSSVYFYQMIEQLIADGVTTFIEIGPKRTLSSFVKKINREVTICNVEDRASLEKTLNQMEAL